MRSTADGTWRSLAQRIQLDRANAGGRDRPTASLRRVQRRSVLAGVGATILAIVAVAGYKSSVELGRRAFIAQRLGVRMWALRPLLFLPGVNRQYQVVVPEGVAGYVRVRGATVTGYSFGRNSPAFGTRWRHQRELSQPELSAVVADAARVLLGVQAAQVDMASLRVRNRDVDVGGWTTDQIEVDFRAPRRNAMGFGRWLVLMTRDGCVEGLNLVTP